MIATRSTQSSLTIQEQLLQLNVSTPTTPKIEATELPDPIEWIEANFYIPETGKPIVLADYQRIVIREALSKDENGLFRYSTILWSDTKKTAKSTISGCVALYLAWHTPYETVRIVANDLKQADSRTFYYIERAIKLNPQLRNLCIVNKYKIALPNNTVIQAIPVDPKGEAGGGDLVTCFTELWAYKNDASKQLWVETALSPLKYGKSLRWCETYAGYDGESPILEQLHRQGVLEGTPIKKAEIPDLELWSNGRILALWNTKPRCAWLTPAYYAQEVTQYTPSEYSRIHENKWARSTEAFVPDFWWDSCEQPFPEFHRHTPVVLAIDAAVSGDCFAMVGISRVNKIAYVRYVKVWYPPKGGQIAFSEPMAELERLVKLWNVEQVVFDEYQMTMFSQQVIEKGIVYMKPFSQAGRRLEADKNLYDFIREKTIAHDGNPILREHILNANRKAEADNKLRLVKRTETSKIDAAVACSMSLHAVVELEL